MKVEFKINTQSLRIDEEGVRSKPDEWLTQNVLPLVQKIIHMFFETYVKDQTKSQKSTKLKSAAFTAFGQAGAKMDAGDLKETDISFRIEPREQCNHSCYRIDGHCNKGCTWKNSLVLEINMPSMDAKKNRIIARLIKIFIEDSHPLDNFKLFFSKGILRVVSDDHDAANEIDTRYADQRGELNRPSDVSELEGYVRYGNITVVDRIFGPSSRGGDGGYFFNIEEAIAKSLKEHNLGPEMAAQIRELMDIKDRNLQEAVRSAIVEEIKTCPDFSHFRKVGKKVV